MKQNKNKQTHKNKTKAKMNQRNKHLLTTLWLMPSSSPSSNHWLLATPLSSYVLRMTLWYGILLCSVQVLPILAVLPLSFLCSSSLAEHGKPKNLWLGVSTIQQWLKNINVLSIFFSCWIQNTALYQFLQRKLTIPAKIRMSSDQSFIHAL